MKTQDINHKPETKHTPTPWFYEAGSIWADVRNGSHLICEMRGQGRAPVGEAMDNAAFIVRVVNAHDELVERLKGCANAYHWASMSASNPEHQHDLERCENIACIRNRAVIAKADGRS